MQPLENLPPLSVAEEALVQSVTAFIAGDCDPADIAARCGFTLTRARTWDESVPRHAYQTYARAHGRKLTLLRNVIDEPNLPSWRLVADDGFIVRHFDLSLDAEADDQPGGAAVFAAASVGIVLLVLVIWIISLAW